MNLEKGIFYPLYGPMSPSQQRYIDQLKNEQNNEKITRIMYVKAIAIAVTIVIFN